MLRDKPLAHHDKLLRLTEQGNEKERDKLWSDFDLIEIKDEDWKILTDERYDGTLEQRDFVRRALSTPISQFSKALLALERQRQS